MGRSGHNKELFQKLCANNEYAKKYSSTTNRKSIDYARRAQDIAVQRIRKQMHTKGKKGRPNKHFNKLKGQLNKAEKKLANVNGKTGTTTPQTHQEQKNNKKAKTKEKKRLAWEQSQQQAGRKSTSGRKGTCRRLTAQEILDRCIRRPASAEVVLGRLLN